MFLSPIYHFSAFFHRNSLILKYSKGWKIHLLSSSLCFYLPAGEGASARHTLHQNLHKIQLHILYLVITFCVYSLVKDLGLECHTLSFTEHRAYLQYKFI